MKLVNNLYDFIRVFIDLIYPDLCLICHDSLSDSEDILCVTCKSHLPVVEPDYTDILLRKKLIDINPEFLISYLLYRKGNLSQQLLYTYKYEGIRQIGHQLGRWFGHYILENYDTNDVDIIVPVPLHPKKKRKRGFNQSEILAREISSVIDKPCVNDVLKRRKSSRTQTQKSRLQRMTNVSQIFQIENHHQLAGKHILIVDDVVTTGSTLSACCDALKKGGASKVSIATLTAAK